MNELTAEGVGLRRDARLLILLGDIVAIAIMPIKHRM
jgi:hypothetical protein